MKTPKHHRSHEMQKTGNPVCIAWLVEHYYQAIHSKTQKIMRCLANLQSRHAVSGKLQKL